MFGNGIFGTGTSKNLHNGPQPSLTSKTSNWSDGTVFFTSWTHLLKCLTEASSPSDIDVYMPGGIEINDGSGTGTVDFLQENG